MSHEFEHLFPPGTLSALVRRWIDADIPYFDIGGYVVGDKPEVAHVLGKSPGVLAGVPFANAVFKEMGVSVEWLKREGDPITKEEAAKKAPVAVVKGSARKLLLAERTVLNIISRASGVATRARGVVTAAKTSTGWNGMVAGSRKTTPGFALVEKHALLVGGAATHRMNLSQMVMLKDNHVWSHGSITGAVKAAKAAAGFSAKIEVECQNLDNAREAALAGADVVMLDNFTPGELKRAAAAFKSEFPHVVVEASGGITEANIASYAVDNVDVVSMGCLTHGYACLDFSMKIQRPAAK